MAKILGIRREDRNPWERRAPLAPSHVETLVHKHGIHVRIQPSDIRVFSDDRYRDAGAELTEDMSRCDVVFAVKEIPRELFRHAGTYIFFSHTIKGQAHNMEMLDMLVNLQCQLFDYEKVTDESNRRLVFFGREAGLAGMIDSLWALGGRLKWEGLDTPLAGLKPAKDYSNLAEAREAVSAAGEGIAKGGLPSGAAPMVCGFAGYGNVSQGAQEVYDLLPVEEISPPDLLRMGADGSLAQLPPSKVYKVVFKEEHMVVPVSPDVTFELQDYYDHPEKYRGIFDGYLPHLSMLVNCIFWTEAYPRLVTLDWLKQNFPPGGEPGTPLRVIGDISCDIDGSVQCTLKATDPGDPIYVYDPSDGSTRSGWEGNGPVVLAVDALPSELPEDATRAFGDMLMPYIPGIMANDFSKPVGEYDLPAEFRRALILAHGEFTEDFAYMAGFLK